MEIHSNVFPFLSIPLTQRRINYNVGTSAAQTKPHHQSRLIPGIKRHAAISFDVQLVRYYCQLSESVMEAVFVCQQACDATTLRLQYL